MIGSSDEVLPIGWADDLAILADFAEPRELQRDFPRIATVALSTLRFLRFRVNLGEGKTEAMLDIRGPQAKAVRGELLTREATLDLPTGDRLRLTPEYRYLGVIQSPKDTGRRDMELNAQRAQSAWAHARSMLACPCLPWPLKRAWLEGRVLPAAYATLATSTAVSLRATAPLEGFYERAARQLTGSWQYGHCLTKPLLYSLLGLSAPRHATVIARVRLVVQLATRAPCRVKELFDAAWARGTPWCLLLLDACQAVSDGLPGQPLPCLALSHIGGRAKELLAACKFLSRWGSLQSYFCEVWADIAAARPKAIIGAPEAQTCSMCLCSFPSKQALAAHVHRKHSVVNCLTRYTNGSICVWCNTDMHSLDRLKYHLKVSPACVHGLRVTVGTIYQYGSGTKRSGRRQHRGLPPLRLSGPLNATPAQREAASANRECTEEELRAELYRATGAQHPLDWPRPGTNTEEVSRSTISPTDATAAEIASVPSSLVDQHRFPTRWWSLSDATDMTNENSRLPSPLWWRLRQQTNVWQLPRGWHRWWSTWWAASQQRPWHFGERRHFRALRAASTGPCSDTGPPGMLVDLLAATVTLRQVCDCISQSPGMLWILGAPSRVGISVLRALMPSAVFHSFPSDIGTAFVAAHPGFARTTWRAPLGSLLSAIPKGCPPCTAPLRASLLYHPGSLGS